MRELLFTQKEACDEGIKHGWSRTGCFFHDAVMKKTTIPLRHGVSVQVTHVPGFLLPIPVTKFSHMQDAASVPHC